MRVLIYFVNFMINPGDPRNPSQKFLCNEVFFNLAPGTMYRTADIFLQSQTMVTDKNISPLSNYETEEFPIYVSNDWRE